MNIAEIDKNFAFANKIDKDDVVWYEADKAPFKLYGAYSASPYYRLDPEVAKNTSDGVTRLNRCTAGIRARFKCDSPYLALRVEQNEGYMYLNMCKIAMSGFTLHTVGENRDDSFVCVFPPCHGYKDGEMGYESVHDIRGVMTDYVLDFPMYNSVEKVYIGVKEGTKFEEPKEYANQLPVIFYGSSITQGGCASNSGNSYQNFLSRWLNMHYINLGFSGSAKAEDAIVDYMADLQMSVFVCDYDYNAPSVEHLEKTHFRLYEKIREKHPDIPYIMITMPRLTNKRRTQIIHESYEKALALGDKNVYYIDGMSLFGGLGDHTVDGTHPNDLGFYKFAKALEPYLKKFI